VPEGELERWMTAGRIANSDFMRVVFEGVRAGAWSVEEAQEVSLAALRGFGNGSCYFLASAVAGATGGTVVGFWRRKGDERLVHAVVHDARDGHASDVLGRRLLSEVRRELEDAVGALRLSVLPSIGADMDAQEVDCLLDIAAGLPWMGVGRIPLPHAAWGSLMRSYVDAREDERLRRTRPW
jgi:hypothetical protein